MKNKSSSIKIALLVLVGLSISILSCRDGNRTENAEKSANYYTDDEQLEGPYFDEDPLNNNDNIIPGSEVGVKNKNNDNFNNNDGRRNYNDKNRVNNNQ